ncbi:MAG: glutathione S-transferase family protein [Amphiplicatus sp.]
MRRLYDLRLADPAVRPSPYCWRAKWALLHKGLDFETVPLRFDEKQNYPDPPHVLVPTLDDGGVLISDSARILDYLDETYPEKPLTRTSGERAAVDFYWSWLLADLLPALAPLAMFKVFEAVDPADRAYFREAREKRFGKPLERLADDPALPTRVTAALKMLEGPLAAHEFLGGETPNPADYLVGGFMMWTRIIGAEALFEKPAAVEAWTARLLDLYDGYARKAKCVGRA